MAFIHRLWITYGERRLGRRFGEARGGKIKLVPLLQNLKHLREERGMTVRRLSARSGVSADSISDFEELRRMASPRTARKLAEALGAEPEELVGER